MTLDSYVVDSQDLQLIIDDIQGDSPLLLSPSVTGGNSYSESSAETGKVEQVRARKESCQQIE